jgi:FERM domain-containing protein 3/5
LGDYDPERHLHGYVSEMNLILSPSEKVEQQIVDFHSGKVGAIPGTSPMQAVNAFLKKAVTLDTYGIDPHPVKVSGLDFAGSDRSRTPRCPVGRSRPPRVFSWETS